MDKMDDNKGTPTKDTGSNNNISLNNTFNSEFSGKPEIAEPNPMIGIPVIPVEMPAREE